MARTWCDQWPLLCTALFAAALIVFRAATQSITIDEADSYVYFVSGIVPGLTHWQPHSNNHLLNTLTLHLFTALFGVSNLTLRSSALIGATVYLTAVYRFCRLAQLGLNVYLSAAAFICMAMNPFVLDYLIAARGYSLAMGFLLTALYYIVRHLLDCMPEVRPASPKLQVKVSLLLAASFLGNFAFAYVNLWTGAFFLVYNLYALRRAGKRSDFRPWLELFSLSVLPGLFLAFVIGGYTVLRMPKGQLVYGSQSVREMRDGILSNLFFQPNPQILNPTLITWFRNFGLYWTSAFLACLILSFVMELLAARRQAYASPYKGLVFASTFLLGVLTATFVSHWLMFEVAGILLPKNRTSIFFVLLFLCSFIVLCCVEWQPLRSLNQALLVIGAIYFLGCLRIEYFQEWQFNAHSDRSFHALCNLAGDRHVKVPINWRFMSVFNYYQLVEHDTHFEHFTPAFKTEDYPPGMPLYVLSLDDGRDLLASRHLHIVYQDDLSHLVIAAP